jgi:hypothetical protein
VVLWTPAASAPAVGDCLVAYGQNLSAAEGKQRLVPVDECALTRVAHDSFDASTDQDMVVVVGLHATADMVDVDLASLRACAAPLRVIKRKRTSASAARDRVTLPKGMRPYNPTTHVLLDNAAFNALVDDLDRTQAETAAARSAATRAEARIRDEVAVELGNRLAAAEHAFAQRLDDAMDAAEERARRRAFIEARLEQSEAIAEERITTSAQVAEIKAALDFVKDENMSLENALATAKADATTARAELEQAKAAAEAAAATAAARIAELEAQVRRAEATAAAATSNGHRVRAGMPTRDPDAAFAAQDIPDFAADDGGDYGAAEDYGDVGSDGGGADLPVLEASASLAADFAAKREAVAAGGAYRPVFTRTYSRKDRAHSSRTIGAATGGKSTMMTGGKGRLGRLGLASTIRDRFVSKTAATAAAKAAPKAASRTASASSSSSAGTDPYDDIFNSPAPKATTKGSRATKSRGAAKR